MPHDYPPPVYALVRLGEAEFGHTRWMDYPEHLGLGPEHVPDLVRVLRDPAWMEVDEDAPEAFAPIHAWRALAQLRAEEAIPALLDVVRRSHEEDDWIIEDVGTVFERIGPPAFTPLVSLFRDRSRPDHVRSRAASGLTDIGKAYPELRAEAVRVLTQALNAYISETDHLNVSIVGNLLSLNAIESLPSIRRAFDEERMDERLLNWADVQRELGMGQVQLAHHPGAVPNGAGDPRPGVPLFDRNTKRRLARLGKKMAKRSRKQNRRK